MPQDQPASVGPVWPLVGRERELELIAAALDDPDCHGLGLIGAPGVGKTRLARSVVELAAARGMTPVLIRATATATDFPFAALTPLLLELGVDLGQVDQPMLAIARAVADGREAGGRFLLIIDDAPLLDAPSRSIIDQLAGMPGVFLVLTVREGGGDISPSLGLWKDDQVRRLRVEPLDVADLMTLVQVALGGPVDGATLRSLTDTCAGNLLLLRELVLGALESGLLSTPHGIWRLNGSLARSPRLQNLIDHRLAGVTEEQRETLELVALGEPSTRADDRARRPLGRAGRARGPDRVGGRAGVPGAALHPPPLRRDGPGRPAAGSPGPPLPHPGRRRGSGGGRRRPPARPAGGGVAPGGRRGRPGGGGGRRPHRPAPQGLPAGGPPGPLLVGGLGLGGGGHRPRRLPRHLRQERGGHPHHRGGLPQGRD